MRANYLFIVLFLLLPVELLAWGQKGHRIIAQIAYDQLDLITRNKIDRVLGSRGGAVYWANWADEIKSDTIYRQSYDWHFQDLDGGLSDSAVVATLTHYPQVGGNLWRAMDSLQVVLRENPKDEHALRFLIHLMGDVYCPMHTAHLDDMGGNTIRMKWFGQQVNLHSVWDSHIIEARGYSYSEYATYLEAIYRGEKRAIQRETKENLVLKNYDLVEQVYAYQQNWDGNTYHYIYRFSSQMEHQLYVSGIRLAKMLKSIY